MVDTRMAQATAVHTKITLIATIRLNMAVCLSTLSAAPPTQPVQLALSSTFHCKVTSFVVAIDPDVREEYWKGIPALPQKIDQPTIKCPGKYGGKGKWR